MMNAKFTITYYYKKYESGDIDKRYSRTAIVYATNLSDAIKKIRALDNEYISVADNGVSINEMRGKSENTVC